MSGSMLGTDRNAEGTRLRRVWGEVACAECRRLRIRCDRQIPCAACKRRGCSDICPTGSPPTVVQRENNNLATPVQLHEKIRTMQDRVQELEVALRQAQSLVSQDVHSLLVRTDQDPGVEQPLDRRSASSKFERGQGTPPEGHIKSETTPGGTSSADGLSRAFGILTISPEYGFKWYGKTAASEHFLDNQEKPATTPCVLPPELVYLSICPPYAAFHGLFDSSGARFEHWLPPRDTARRLVDCYFGPVAALFSVVPRDQFDAQAWRPLYEAFKPVALDRLSLMFLVLALGALVDLAMPPRHPNPDADMYFRLARSALAGRPSSDLPSLLDVQTEFLSGFYLQMVARREESWVSIGVAAKMAQLIGLHMDPESMQLPNEEVELRRRIFWEVRSFEMMHSLGFGRPPVILDPFSDTHLPRYVEEVDEKGRPCQSYHRLKHGFYRKHIVTLTHEVLTANHSSTYESILLLDKDVRDDLVPAPHLRIGASPASGFGQSEDGLTVQRCMGYLYRQLILIYIHRAYSCRAASEMPSNPLKHRFGPSVLATYKSTTAMIDTVTSLFDQHPILTRIIPFYAITFTAATALGTLVIFAPHWGHASKVLMYLDKLCAFFETAEMPQVRKLHPHLLTLRTKARAAYSRRHLKPYDRSLELELALRLSGDKPVIDSTARNVELAGSPAFLAAHPAIVNYLDELGPSVSGTPWVGEDDHQGEAKGSSPPDVIAGAPSSDLIGESWRFYVTRIGLPA